MRRLVARDYRTLDIALPHWGKPRGSPQEKVYNLKRLRLDCMFFGQGLLANQYECEELLFLIFGAGSGKKKSRRRDAFWQIRSDEALLTEALLRLYKLHQRCLTELNKLA